MARTSGEMPRRKKALFDAVKKREGELITRAELADATGKRVLSPNDLNHLNSLVDEGLIEEGRKQDADAVIGLVIAYRYVHKNEETGAQG